MDKSRFYDILSRHIQRLDLAGKKLVTVEYLSKLFKKAELSRQQIGIWLKAQGFQRVRRKRTGKSLVAQWFLNEEAIGVIRKKNRIGLRCGYTIHTDKKDQQIDFYYDMPPDEEFAPGSSSIIQKVGHPEQWKVAFCPICNREDHYAHYSIEATKNIKRAKKEIIFKARRITPQGNLADPKEGSFSGPGMLQMPDNLKGQW